MTHADTLDRALRLLSRSRRVLDYMADEVIHGRELDRTYAGIAEDLAGEIVALIGHSVTDQPEAPEMFALRDYLDDLAESESPCIYCGESHAGWCPKLPPMENELLGSPPCRCGHRLARHDRQFSCTEPDCRCAHYAVRNS